MNIAWKYVAVYKIWKKVKHKKADVQRSGSDFKFSDRGA